MTNSDTSEHPTQMFQVESSRPFNIISRRDNDTRKHIILWKDIQRVIKNAAYVKLGADIVSFMTDECFEDLVPLRIEHHPGQILEVVIETYDQASGIVRDGRIGKTDGPTPTLEEFAFAIQPKSINAYSDAAPILTRIDAAEVQRTYQQLAGLAIANAESMDKHLVSHSTEMSSESKSSLQAYSQLYKSFLEAVKSGQEVQAAGIKRDMDVRFDQLQVEMERNRGLQRQLLEKQGEIQQLQQQMAAKQQEILDKQQQALNHLALIQNRIHAIFTQNYELHEYPIPRLFIVLPKPMRRRDALVNLVSQHFRLFFLCECGTHTMSEGSRIPHEIHMAKHEGYEINKPTEFFQKFGPRVLKVLQWLRYGIAIAGVVVPPLAQFKLVKGIDEFKKNFDVSKENIGPLIDQSISYLQGQIDSRNDDKVGAISEHTELEKLEVLEGADLRQLESYLRDSDQGRSLANLYRIVTPEGHVKWVCIDHYRENYRLSAMKQLKDVVEANEGTFIEEEGKIEVKIGSKIQARQFYEAMVNTRGVQELDITLQWDVTKEDLQTFAAAVTKANIVHLRMDGSSFKGPAVDVVNRGRRFDPLMQLMSNGRIQSLNLMDFKDFYQRISTASITVASQLRVLSIVLPIEPSIGQYPLLRQILSKCPSLMELTVDTRLVNEALSEVRGNGSLLRNLKKLQGNSQDANVVMSISHGDVTDLMAASKRFNFVSDHRGILQRGCLTSLRLDDMYWDSSQQGISILGRTQDRIPNLGNISLQELENIAHLNPNLSKDCVSTIGSFKAIREKLIASDQLCAALEVAIYTKPVWKDDTVRRVVRIQFPGTQQVADDMVIELDTRGWATEGHSDLVSDLFHQFGPFVGCLETGPTFSDRSASELDDETRSCGSNLTFLALDSTSLTFNGLDCMDQVIARSQKLEQLRLDLGGLETAFGQEKALRLLSQHGMTVSDLVLHGKSADSWIPSIGSHFPTRCELPKLTSFTLECPDTPQVPYDFAQWIAAMISGPPQLPTSLSDSKTPSQDTTIPEPMRESTETSQGWKALRVIKLGNIKLHPDNWRIVINAMDISALDVLDFENSNFSREQLDVLADCIPDSDDLDVSLKELTLNGTDLVKYVNLDALKKVVAKLKEKAPLVQVKGLPF
ncbi:hypothetical protein BGZ58_008863 [Dissophora ornata]|nr:hypothetical protein BGZ58_008863 [Dissophora ornata]